jgi:hypothetical protein
MNNGIDPVLKNWIDFFIIPLLQSNGDPVIAFLGFSA